MIDFEIVDSRTLCDQSGRDHDVLGLPAQASPLRFSADAIVAFRADTSTASSAAPFITLERGRGVRS